jgi:hypothetical protein
VITLPLLLVGTTLLGNVQATPLTRHLSRLAGGVLQVVSATPGAWVRVDGDVLGRTPVRVAGLAAGAHRVEVAGAHLDVEVQDGTLTQLSAGKSGLQVVAPAPVAAPTLEAERLPAPDWDALRGMLAQPWAYAAAAFTGVSLLGAGVLWTATPERFPVVGSLPVQVAPWQYTALRWGSVAVVAAGAMLTVALFVIPSLPWVRSLFVPKPAG